MSILFQKVLDVDRMIVKTTTPSSKDHGMLGMENHPVIRTLYDHVEVIARTGTSWSPTRNLPYVGRMRFKCYIWACGVL